MSNRLAFAALAVACMTAAAGGGYLATRQNAVPAPMAAQTVPASQPAPAPAAQTASTPATPSQPVQETEAVIGDKTVKADSKSTASGVTAPKTARRNDAPATKTASRDATPSGGAAGRPAESAPQLSSTWPSSAAQQPPSPAAPEPPRDDHQAQEPARAPEPPKPTFEELVVSRDSVIGLQTDSRVSSETAAIEDRVDAHVTRDVRVGDRVAIPAGAKVIGAVTQVERGGKYKERAKLGIRFHTIVLGDGTRLPISTEAFVREGDAPSNSSAAKIGGGAAIGAILGAIAGGAKGAAIGAGAGAGAGTAAVQMGDRSQVVLPSGTPLTTRILSPVTVTIERE